MSIRSFAAIAAAALIFIPSHGSAMQILIDDFTTDQRVTDGPGIDGVASQVAAPEALGGWRDMWVESDLSGLSNTTFESGSGFLSFSNDTNATGRALLTYDGNAAGATSPVTSISEVDTDGLGGINFLVGPNPFISFDVNTFESDLFFEARVWDMDGNFGNFTEILPPEGSFSPDLPLTDFTFAGGTFDWTQVGAVQFFVESSTIGYDGSITSISVNPIPLPASALLLLSGVGMLAYRRIRG
ncbi:MAG: hypothetical protein R6V44_05520 [Paracoccaceae bacterium]